MAENPEPTTPDKAPEIPGPVNPDEDTPTNIEPNLLHRPLEQIALSAWQDRERFSTFFFAAGGTLFYALSALSIVYGITQIIGPPLAHSNELADILPCIWALNGYELALFVVLMALVLWRHITSDTISLVVMVGIFWIASAMTLGVIVPSGLDMGLAIGVAATVIAVIKLWALRHYLAMNIGVLTFLGVTIMLAWNFITPSLMVRPMAAHVADDTMRRNHWLFGWLILLLGSALIYIDAIKRDYPAQKESTVFLRTPAMTWILALILMAGSMIHQYGIAYMFAVDAFKGDYLLLLCLLLLMGIELGRSLGLAYGPGQLVMGAIPLVLTILAVINKATVEAGSLSGEGLFYPPVILGAMGLVLWGLSIRHQWHNARTLAIAYGLGALLTLGRNHELNIALFGVSVIVTVGILGILKRNAQLCCACVVMFSVALGHHEGFNRLIGSFEVSQAQALSAVLGLGLLTIAIGFGKQTPGLMIFVGVSAMAYSLLKMPGQALHWNDLGACLVLVGLFAGLILRTNTWLIGLILWIPIGLRGYTLAIDMSSWSFVVLSFPLLFLGAGISLLRKHKAGLKEAS